MVALLRDVLAMQYQDSQTQFRVEARVAAALAWSLQVIVMPTLLQERVQSGFVNGSAVSWKLSKIYLLENVI